MFANTTNITANDFYNNTTINNDYKSISENNTLKFDFERVTFNLVVTNNSKQVFINCENPDVSYYIGLNPLTSDYLFTSTFTFSFNDTSEYYVSIKYNEKIIIIGKIKMI